MKTRGRKSAAEVAIVERLPEHRPPPPPAVLTDFEAALWHRLTATLPGEHWAGSENILESYCVHAGIVSVIDKAIREFRQEWLGTDDGLLRFRQLSDQRVKNSAAMVNLARSLRLTPHSRSHKESAARRHSEAVAKSGDKPWE